MNKDEKLEKAQKSLSDSVHEVSLPLMGKVKKELDDESWQH